MLPFHKNQPMDVMNYTEIHNKYSNLFDWFGAYANYKNTSKTPYSHIQGFILFPLKCLTDCVEYCCGKSEII